LIADGVLKEGEVSDEEDDKKGYRIGKPKKPKKKDNKPGNED